MRLLLSLVLLIGLVGCASKLPEPDPRMAWIDITPSPSDTLMANRLDNKRWHDGRYFQVPPGTHVLELRYQFEISGGLGMNAAPSLLTCYLELRYDGFEAAKRYQVQARNAANQPMAWLYDEHRQVLARHGAFPRCGAF